MGLNNHPMSRVQPAGRTPGSAVIKIEQQPLGQEIWREALEMWGVALKDAARDTWRETLGLYEGSRTM